MKFPLWVDLTFPELIARRAATIEPTIQKPINRITPSKHRPANNSIVLVSILSLSLPPMASAIAFNEWCRIPISPPLRMHPACIRRGRDEADFPGGSITRRAHASLHPHYRRGTVLLNYPGLRLGRLIRRVPSRDSEENSSEFRPLRGTGTGR